MSDELFDLFGKSTKEIPFTEGIKYAGSKLKLLPHILDLVQNVKPQTVLDGFAGSTRVSQALAQSDYQVISNDTSVWSEVFNKAYLLNIHPKKHYQELITHLNGLQGIDGWFSSHYGGKPTDIKKPWQIHNTKKLDAIRLEIDKLNLSDTERSVALASLILALDEVDSSLGHFASYLNEWSARSYKTMQLRVPNLWVNKTQHQIHRGDIFDLLPQIQVDLAYFDPPYGSNNEKMPPSRVRYAAYYHLWTTVCLNDKPDVFGKANRRSDSSDKIAYSPFEDFRKNQNNRFIATETIERLLKEVRARYIVLSYSSGGRATAEELFEAINAIGKVIEMREIDYKKNVMANMKWTHEWIQKTNSNHREFLFLIEKSDSIEYV